MPPRILAPGREEIGRIKAWLDDHFHRYRLVEATRGNVPLEFQDAESLRQTFDRCVVAAR